MSLGRRSERSKKQVNYSQFCTEEGDEDLSTNSDDDFQDSPGPPNKKCKVDKPKYKPKQEENERKISSKRKEPPKKKERLCIEDKIYKRELEAALEASRRESSQDDSKSIDEEEIDSEQEGNDIHPRLKQERAKLTSTSEDNDKENDSVFDENKPRKVKSSEADELKSDTGIAERKSKNNTTWKEESEGDLQGPKTEDHTVEEVQTGNGSDLYLEKDDSDNESFGEDEDEESDFEELQKKQRKRQNRVQQSATSTRPSIKPRTSVTVTPIKMRTGKKRGKAKGLSAASSGYSLSPSISSSASNSPSSF